MVVTHPGRHRNMVARAQRQLVVPPISAGKYRAGPSPASRGWARITRRECDLGNAALESAPFQGACRRD
jgi:hypothetical protein